MTPMNVIEQLSFDWGKRCFGEDHVYNKPIRALRCAEEAIELTQALGVSKDKVLKLVEYVYSRPQGNPFQELGGIALTLGVSCMASGTSIEAAAFAELRRILAKDPKHFTERNQNKINLGFTA